MKVLLLDGETNAAVACVRSLAKAGHEVTVGSAEQWVWCKAARSRFAYASFKYPDPLVEPQRFINTIISQIERSGERRILLLPATEPTMLVVSRVRERLQAAGSIMVIPPHREFVTACSKHEMTKLASSLGVRTPRTTSIEDPQLAAEIARDLQYPIVLKCHSSQQILPDNRVVITPKPRYARNLAEFLQAYRQLSSACGAILAQEFIHGVGVGYSTLMCQGELRAEFAHLRIREADPSGSGSSLRIGIAVPLAVREAGLRLLRELKWHGVAMVEFRIHQDGTPVFLEVNPRFWNSLTLAVYSGIDFPALLAAVAEHGDVALQLAYRPNVRCRWLLGDFIHLWKVWSGAPAGYPGTYPTSLSTLMKLMLPVAGTLHDNFTFDDPLPELADWITTGAHFCKKRLTRGRTNSHLHIASRLAKLSTKAGQPH